MLQNLLAKFRPSSHMPSPAGCVSVQSRIFDYLDGALTPVERATVDSHIETCAVCRMEMAGCRRSEAMLGTAATTIPSPGDLRPEFYARLDRSRRRSPAPFWAVAAPAVACAVLIGLFFSGRYLAGLGSAHGPATVAMLPGSATPSRHEGVINHERERKVAILPAPTGRTADSLTRRRNTEVVKNMPVHERQPQFGVRTVKLGRLRVPTFKRQFLAQSEPHGRTFRSQGNPVVTPELNSLMATEAVSPRVLAYSDRATLRSLATATPATLNRSYGVRDRREMALDSLTSQARGEERHPKLASFVTELHVSDEDRDFMSSTHIGATVSHKDRAEMLGVDGDNDNPQEPVELPALP